LIFEDLYKKRGLVGFDFEFGGLTDLLLEFGLFYCVDALLKDLGDVLGELDAVGVLLTQVEERHFLLVGAFAAVDGELAEAAVLALNGLQELQAGRGRRLLLQRLLHVLNVVLRRARDRHDAVHAQRQVAPQDLRRHDLSVIVIIYAIVIIFQYC
jgi:hypothetical protein